jgi:hypothetical protein
LPCELASWRREGRVKSGDAEDLRQGASFVGGEDGLRNGVANVNEAANASSGEDAEAAIPISRRPDLEVLPERVHPVKGRQGAVARDSKQAMKPGVIRMYRELTLKPCCEYEGS